MTTNYRPTKNYDDTNIDEEKNEKRSKFRFLNPLYKR